MNPLGKAIISLEPVLVGSLSAIQTVCASQEGTRMSLLSVFYMGLQLPQHRNGVLWVVSAPAFSHRHRARGPAAAVGSQEKLDGRWRVPCWVSCSSGMCSASFTRDWYLLQVSSQAHSLLWEGAWVCRTGGCAHAAPW